MSGFSAEDAAWRTVPPVATNAARWASICFTVANAGQEHARQQLLPWRFATPQEWHDQASGFMRPNVAGNRRP